MTAFQQLMEGCFRQVYCEIFHSSELVIVLGVCGCFQRLQHFTPTDVQGLQFDRKAMEYLPVEWVL